LIEVYLRRFMLNVRQIYVDLRRSTSDIGEIGYVNANTCQ